MNRLASGITVCLAAWFIVTGAARLSAAEMNQPLPNEIKAGPIWNEGDAQKKCPNVCAQVHQPWSGLWRTTVWGTMSVCSCAASSGGMLMPGGVGTSCSAPPMPPAEDAAFNARRANRLNAKREKTTESRPPLLDESLMRMPISEVER